MWQEGLSLSHILGTFSVRIPKVIDQIDVSVYQMISKGPWEWHGIQFTYVLAACFPFPIAAPKYLYQI